MGEKKFFHAIPSGFRREQLPRQKLKQKLFQPNSLQTFSCFIISKALYHLAQIFFRGLHVNNINTQKRNHDFRLKRKQGLSLSAISTKRSFFADSLANERIKSHSNLLS
jgi:hypothetical protein